MCTGNATGQVSLKVSDRGDQAPAADSAILDDLVVANHILFDQGVVDAFGHVSVRHDKDPTRFLLARNMAPGQVELAEIVALHHHGTPGTARRRRVYLERFIHGEIYSAFPEVAAVVHSHSHSIVPLSVVKDRPLRALFHMAGFIGEGAPVFEIRDAAGPGTDLLISNPELGRALAAKLRGHSIVLMRGHGSTVVAGSLQQVVYRAVYAELNARYQLEATRLGEITYLTAAEAEACIRNVEPQMQRPWALWKEAAAARRATCP